MIIVVILYFLMLCCSCIKKQSETVQTPIVETTNTELLNDSNENVFIDGPWDPEAFFPYGEEAMYDFLNKRVKYPNNANTQGRVMGRITIEKDGTISEIEIAKGVQELLDNEVLRVLDLLPKSGWIPAKLDGEPIKSVMNIPITFKLSESSKFPKSSSIVAIKKN